MTFKPLILSVSCLLTLSACSYLGLGEKEEATLQGERLSLYDFEKTLQTSPDTQFGLDGSENASVLSLSGSLKGGPDTAMALDEEWNNQFWPQAGGYATHAMRNVAFNKAQPTRKWTRDIGKGATKRMPLSAAPIMANDRVYTLNNEAEVTAVLAETGKKIWTTDILKSGEDEVVIGGGVAFSGGRIFATNGFNEVVAIDAGSGEILWRTATKTPIRAAPAALPDKVFVTTMDNETLALNAYDGTQIWSHRGLSSGAAVFGAATPALTRDAVITAYSSGEIYALQMGTGTPLWSENLAPLARAAGTTGFSDIRALPIVDSNIVYAASYSNRLSAIDSRTGKQLWQVPLGSGSTPWVSGNRLFMVDSLGTMISVDHANGQVIWQVDLPRFKDAKDNKGAITWQGPYLAGGRLLIFGSHGMAQSYNPVDGSLMNEWKIGNDILLPAAIAEGTLYLLGNNGKLTAWE